MHCKHTDLSICMFKEYQLQLMPASSGIRASFRFSTRSFRNTEQMQAALQDDATPVMDKQLAALARKVID